MMDFIMVPAVMGIITLGIYKLFELFVRKKERLIIIDKIGDKLTPEILSEKIDFSTNIPKLYFSALKFGCLFMGLGIGMLVAFTIHYNFADFVESSYQIIGAIYGSCVLLFGGLWLIIAFIIELKICNKK
ncbi:MAG: hypothetical protein E7088_01560 [Bacteroidales bacterium]|nr:hypothetical protein [Bacteroidales bacterium]